MSLYFFVLSGHFIIQLSVYSKAILDSEYNYFTSEEYLDICSKLEHELPFVRNTYLPEL